MRLASYALAFWLCALQVAAASDNQVQTGDIHDSHVFIFQGTRFNLKDEASTKRLIEALQQFPTVVRELETFIGARLDASDRRGSMRVDKRYRRRSR